MIVPLLLSGCINIKELLEGEKSILRPEIIKVTVPTDAPRPPGKAICPEPAGTEKPAGEEGKPQEPCPSVEEKLLPRELPLQSPEQLMPIPPPASPKPPEEPRSGVSSPSRSAAAAAAPAFSYDNALLSEDVTWHGEVLVRGVVTVAPQATLTIEPGTVVRFGADAGASGAKALLLVHGRVAANGTQEGPVLFTSRFTEPVAGDWQGIVMLGSEKKNLLENCRLEGAETGLDASFSNITLKNVIFTRCATGARLQDTVVTAAGGGARDCDTGLELIDSEIDLRDPAFSGNRRGVVAERSSLYLVGGSFTGNGSVGMKASNSRVRIATGKFTANGAGLLLASSQGSVAACRIAENADFGIALNGSRVKVYGNEIVNNGKAGLKVEDGKGAAWGNSFSANGEYDLINAGSEDFRAMGNWWGEMPPAGIGRRIYDRQADGRRGKVLYLPALETKPAALP